MALTRSDAPLVWIDCEMTGLDPRRDTILSLSCFLTTAQLELIEPAGYHCTVGHSAAQLARMSPWCVRQHGASGLTAQCLASDTTAEAAAAGLLAYIRQHLAAAAAAGGAAEKPLLAGNSVHADRAFLAAAPAWAGLLDLLHYRLFDVSACKEMVRRWCAPAVLAAAPRKLATHTARADILESLDEARFYRALLASVTLPAGPGTTTPQ